MDITDASAGAATGARRRGRFGSRLVLLSATGVLVGAAAAPLTAQELSLRRDLPGSGRFSCPSAEPPTDSDPRARAQAAELASSAARSVILDDLPRARALLDRAVALDPASAELAYNRARILEDLGESEAAIGDYCRVQSTAPDGRFDDVAARIEVLAEAGHGAVPRAAVRAARTALSAADAGNFERAAAAFGEAMAAAPTWPDAAYNRGVVHARLGRYEEAMTDFHRYLELRPDARNSLEVSQRIGQLESLAVLGTPSPGTALTLGVLFPGMGQFYSGRGVGGVTVLSLAAGAVAAGFLVQEVNVLCLDPVGPGESCPPSDVVARETVRPHLKPALGAAVVVALLGAVEAYGAASSRRNVARQAASPADTRRPVLRGPSVEARGAAVDLNFFRVEFR